MALSNTLVSRPAQTRFPNNRKLNVVVYGIPEQNSDIPGKQKWLSYLKEVTTLFTELRLAISASSIRDCQRLGKFLTANKRPRPILVYFNSCKKAVDILSKRSSFSPYIVKPDLSPEERENKKLLLKERWKLMQTGVNKSDIKIKGNKLSVNGSVTGLDKDSVFSLSNVGTNSSPTLYL